MVSSLCIPGPCDLPVFYSGSSVPTVFMGATSVRCVVCVRVMGVVCGDWCVAWGHVCAPCSVQAVVMVAVMSMASV